ncbi:MAG: RNA 2',3'-cyclic phosphodiesterase [Nanoarchaeota archaeon]|nr:RNA 2',3'-cyclic phosphodiesterase [Nanoarchaeota archaeon]
MEDKTRAFIALELPKDILEHIQKLQKWLDIDGKKTKPEHMHLTIKFLGELTSEKLEEVKSRLGKIKMNALDVKLGKVGNFNNKIVWLGVMNSDPLQQAIDDALEGLFKKEGRFMGHISLGRAKEIRKIPHNKKKLPFKVHEFVLKKSTLGPNGPIYEDIERYTLG